MDTAVACTECGTPLDASALSCPSCHALTHAKELEDLTAKARDAEARGDIAAARELWEKAALLLPPDTVQYKAIRAHLASLKPPETPWWKKGAAGIGPALLLLFTKGKLVLRRAGDGDLSRWMQWVMTIHVRRYLEH